MAEKKISIKVSASIGTVSGKVIEAKKPKAVLVLAHGAGAGMDHPFMKSLAEALAEQGITSTAGAPSAGKPPVPASAAPAEPAPAAKPGH